MIIYKTKWKHYIADLYIPKKKTGKVVVLLPGLPKSSSVEKIVKNFLKLGCIVLYPNFSGSFDSGGLFSGSQCMKDVVEFIKWARQESATELYFQKKINLGQKNKILLAGMSFGALPGLYGHVNNINGLILFSPAIIFNQNDIDKITSHNFQGQMNSLVLLLKKAFPYTYRVKSYSEISNFLYGKNKYQSIKSIKKTLKNIQIPTLIIHGKIDTSIPWIISDTLRKDVRNPLIKWSFPSVKHSTSSYTANELKVVSNFILLIDK